ncbi:unnamed protein product, partial [Didymodactylos carnosus]
DSDCSVEIDAYLGCWIDTKYGQKMTFFNLEPGQLVGITSSGAHVSAVVDGIHIRMSIEDQSGSMLEYKGILCAQQKKIVWQKRLNTFGCWRTTSPWIRC